MNNQCRNLEDYVQVTRDLRVAKHWFMQLQHIKALRVAVPFLTLTQWNRIHWNMAIHPHSYLCKINIQYQQDIILTQQ